MFKQAARAAVSSLGKSTSWFYPPRKTRHTFHQTRHLLYFRFKPTEKNLFTGDIDKERIQMLIDCSVDADIIELPHHGEWSTEAQQLIDTDSPLAVLQSTNITRHAKDQWSTPTETTRFVTAVDGTITSTITKQGDIHISGSHNPDTMPPCISLK